MKKVDIFENPVVIISGSNVKKYYTSITATMRDGYDPYKVAKVCTHGQKTHKGKVFRLASKFDVTAYEMLCNLNKKEV